MSSTRTHTKAASLFILLFVFIAVIPSMVSAAKRMCTLSDRVSPDSCPKDFKNMCAFFSGKDCDSKTCQRLANNECTACLDPNVLYYFDQPCPGDKIYCDSTMRPTECPVEDSPVCAFTEENCVGDSCKKTASSGCQACQDPSVLYYNPYECPVIDEKFYCDVFDFTNKCAETDAKPVCAYFTEQCDKEICSTTVYTSCEACLDPFVLYYKVGECEEELDPRKYCLPGNRPAECISNNDEPVCGFYGADCEGEVCIKDYQSKCNACQDGLVSYFIPGSCDGNILAKEASMMEMIPSAEAKNMDRVFQQEGCMGCDGSDNVNDSFGFISEEETFFGSNHD